MAAIHWHQCSEEKMKETFDANPGSETTDDATASYYDMYGDSTGSAPIDDSASETPQPDVDAGFTQLDETIPDLSLGITYPTASLDGKPYGKQDCSIYFVPLDQLNFCDVTLPSFVLRKVQDASSTTQSNKKLITDLLQWREDNKNSPLLSQCKIKVDNWSRPAPYPIAYKPAIQNSSVATDMPKCYKDASSDADASSIASSFASTFPNILTATSGGVDAFSETPAKTYAEVTFKTITLSDFQSNNFACGTPVNLPTMSQTKFMKLTIAPNSTILAFDLVQYNKTSTPHLKPIPDKSGEFRKFFVYVALNNRILMYAMIFGSSSIHQLTIDSCGRVVKTNTVATNIDKTIPNQLSMTGNLRVKKTFTYTPAFQNAATATLYADYMNNRRLNMSEPAPSGLNSTWINQLQAWYDGNVSSEMAKLTSPPRTCVNINTYGASSDMNDIHGVNGYLYISVGNDFVPTDDDVTLTRDSLPALTVTSGVTQCLSDAAVSDYGYASANEAAKDLCQNVPNATYKGFISKSPNGCGVNANKYTCVGAFNVDTAGYTECITNTDATNRGYTWRDPAGDEACKLKGYDGGWISYQWCSDESPKFRCITNATRTALTTYNGKNIQKTGDASIYKVENGSLRAYSSLAWVYAGSPTPDQIDATTFNNIRSYLQTGTPMSEGPDVSVYYGKILRRVNGEIWKVDNVGGTYKLRRYNTSWLNSYANKNIKKNGDDSIYKVDGSLGNVLRAYTWTAWTYAGTPTLTTLDANTYDTILRFAPMYTAMPKRSASAPPNISDGEFTRISNNIPIGDPMPEPVPYVGIGMDNLIYYKYDLLDQDNAGWLRLENSQNPFIDIHIMKDGTLVGVATDYKVYTRPPNKWKTDGWTLLPNSTDYSITSVTEWNSLLIGIAGAKYVTKPSSSLSTPWNAYANVSGSIILIHGLQDGTLLGFNNATNSQNLVIISSWPYVHPVYDTGLFDITQMPDGSILCVGYDNRLWYRPLGAVTGGINGYSDNKNGKNLSGNGRFKKFAAPACTGCSLS